MIYLMRQHLWQTQIMFIGKMLFNNEKNIHMIILSNGLVGSDRSEQWHFLDWEEEFYTPCYQDFIQEAIYKK